MPEKTPRIRIMRPSDIPEAVRLTDLEDWRFSPGDFRVMLRLCPRGNFVLESGSGNVAGIGSVLMHGNLAWLSNFIIAKEFRGRGWGKRLVISAVRQAVDSGAEHIGLYTYDDRKDFYGQLGFEKTGKYSSYSGKVVNEKAYGGIRPVTAPLLPGVKSLDRNAFGIDRSVFIDRCFRFFRSMFLVCVSSGKTRGYITAGAMPGGGIEISQLVAMDSLTARGLLATLARKSRQAQMWLQVPWDNPRANELMKEYHFKPMRNYVMMTLGKDTTERKKDWLYTLGNLEVW
jgi:ribosomal protein S18 acetylase RimI-like enzyme